jgi:hypothetical protein
MCIFSETTATKFLKKSSPYFQFTQIQRKQLLIPFWNFWLERLFIIIIIINITIIIVILLLLLLLFIYLLQLGLHLVAVVLP